MTTPKFHKVSWDKLHNDCLLLAKKIRAFKFDQIIAISRGGLVWARVFSDLLSIPISHITIESYKNLKQQKEPTITDVPTKSFKNKTILIVDEISDSGKTFKRALSYFKNLHVRKIYTLTPYIKSHTSPLPNFWLNKIDAWIIFPYELRETADAFKKLFKSRNVAKKKLFEIGFAKSQINGVL